MVFVLELACICLYDSFPLFPLRSLVFTFTLCLCLHIFYLCISSLSVCFCLLVSVCLSLSGPSLFLSERPGRRGERRRGRRREGRRGGQGWRGRRARIRRKERRKEENEEREAGRKEKKGRRSVRVCSRVVAALRPPPSLPLPPRARPTASGASDTTRGPRLPSQAASGDATHGKRNACIDSGKVIQDCKFTLYFAGV